ncbi:anti-sigma factor [soil metagenome]
MTNIRAQCPDESVLRAYLDEPDDRTRAHLDACPDCRDRLAAIEQDAGYAADVLARLEPEREEISAPVALAIWRARRNPATDYERGFSLMGFWNRRGARLATGIAGVFALLMVLTISPMGSFAGDVLDRFRVQKFAAITIEMDDFQDFQTNMLLRLFMADQDALEGSVMNLADYMTTFDEDDPMANVQEFDSEADARAAFGDFATTGDVPDGYAKTPLYYVSDAGSVTVTVGTAEAQAIIDELNLPIFALPNASSQPEMVFTLEIPSAVIQHFEGATGEDQIAIAQLPSPTLITPEGLDMDALREDLLALPGLPPDFVAQLRAIDDWESTMVIPVPEGASSDDVTINGEPGLLITSDDGKGSVVLWEDDGILFIVGGTESGDTITNIANSLD